MSQAIDTTKLAGDFVKNNVDDATAAVGAAAAGNWIKFTALLAKFGAEVARISSDDHPIEVTAGKAGGHDARS